jgi:hypothetical protein
MPQSLLETREHRWLSAGVHIDNAVGQEPGLGDGGREEILACDTPEDLAPRARPRFLR